MLNEKGLVIILDTAFNLSIMHIPSRLLRSYRYVDMMCMFTFT